MTMPRPADDPTDRATQHALAAALAEAGGDGGWVSHSEVRDWLGKLAAGDLDVSPPAP